MSDPHAGGRLLRAGTPLPQARAALVLLHGRGAGADDILALGEELAQPGLALLAPEAAGHTWYPQSFLAPRERNEPWASSALARVLAVVAAAAEAGVPAERVVLLGFSQGACLACQTAWENPRRWGGVVALTGGLWGPLGSRFPPRGDLARTPVYLGAGDPDPHIPWERVEETAAALRAMGAVVEVDRFPGLGHTVSREELQKARALVAAVLGEQ